jgi:hypothetical protein
MRTVRRRFHWARHSYFKHEKRRAQDPHRTVVRFHDTGSHSKQQVRRPHLMSHFNASIFLLAACKKRDWGCGQSRNLVGPAPATQDSSSASSNRTVVREDSHLFATTNIYTNTLAALHRSCRNCGCDVVMLVRPSPR